MKKKLLFQSKYVSAEIISSPKYTKGSEDLSRMTRQTIIVFLTFFFSTQCINRTIGFTVNQRSRISAIELVSRFTLMRIFNERYWMLIFSETVGKHKFCNQSCHSLTMTTLSLASAFFQLMEIDEESFMGIKSSENRVTSKNPLGSSFLEFIQAENLQAKDME